MASGKCAGSLEALPFCESAAFVFRHRDWNQICGPALLGELCVLQSFPSEGDSTLTLRFLWSDLQAEVMLSGVTWKQFMCLRLSRKTYA